MGFERGKFKPTPEEGDLVVGDNLDNIGIVQVYEKGPQGEWIVECSDGEIRHVIPMWNAEDEDAGTVEENHWWQDCASRACPWFE